MGRQVLARIEKGGRGGRVRVTKLDSDAVVVELEGTAEPALVALRDRVLSGGGARCTPSGTPEPVVCAHPTVPGGHFMVASAWVKPGRTVFTCDGPLPSDHDGLLISVAAWVFAVVAMVVWSRRRWRMRVLRRAAAWRGRLLKRLPRAKVVSGTASCSSSCSAWCSA